METTPPTGSFNDFGYRKRKRAPESEHFTDKELKRHILDVDKRRARYYQFFTGQTWGDRLNYDLCINTSNYDIK